MKLLKLPRILVLTFTVLVASVAAIAQTLLGLQPASAATSNPTPPVSLNQMSAEFGQRWIGSKTSNFSNSPQIALTGSPQHENTFSGCNCPQCRGASV